MATSQELAKNSLAIKMVQAKIVNPDEQQATIQKVLAELPASTLEADRAKGLSDEEIVDTHFAEWLKGKSNTSDEAVKGKKRTGAPVAITMSAEEQQTFDMLLNSNSVAKGNRTANTNVVAVLTDKPVLSAIHVQGATLTPVISEKAEETLKKYENNLLQTDENKQAFAELTAAWKKKEELAVFLSPNARPKVIGFKVNTIGEDGSPETRIMDKEEAMVFLVFEVNGNVPPKSENGIGIKLRWKASTSAPDATGNVKEGNSIVVIMNRKNITTNPSLSECTSVITDEVTDTYKAKTEKYFLVLTGKPKKDGTPGTRITRLPGVTKAKIVKRAEAYVPKFGQVGERKGSGGMSKSEKAANLTAMRMAMRQLASGQAMSTDYGREAQARLQKSLREMKAPTSNAPLL